MLKIGCWIFWAPGFWAPRRQHLSRFYSSTSHSGVGHVWIFLNFELIVNWNKKYNMRTSTSLHPIKWINRTHFLNESSCDVEVCWRHREAVSLRNDLRSTQASKGCANCISNLRFGKDPNSVAIKAYYARIRYGFRRFVVVNIDAQSSNGTAENCVGDLRALYSSVHLQYDGLQDYFFAFSTCSIFGAEVRKRSAPIESLSISTMPLRIPSRGKWSWS